MIFVDTGAWYASIVPDDEDHAAAERWLNQNSQPLITTDYIVDETLTLLKVRGYPDLAIEMGEMFFGGELAEVIRLTEENIQQAWHIFHKFSDKGWSFTHCTRKALMDSLSIEAAFAFDLHFRQFGSIIVMPGMGEPA